MLEGIISLPWWGYILVTLVMTHITIASVTLYLHRSQAHRAVDFHPLIDHFFRFWFRFVHPHRTLLERGGGQVALEAFVAPQIDQFTGPIFEEIFHEFLWCAGLEGGLPFVPVRVGAWWRANSEIDAIALGQDAALLAECKWSRRPVGMDILQSLEAKAGLVRAELGRRKLFFGLCSRSGFTSQVETEAVGRRDLLLFDLPQIVGR